MRTITAILEDLLARTQADKTYIPRSRAQGLVTVSSTRARVLCPSCHGENDDSFRHCQWCAASSDSSREGPTTRTMLIDEEALSERRSQFQTVMSSRASAKSKVASTSLFGTFLTSRAGGGARTLETAQPEDVLDFLCWLDSCGSGRRTIVHVRDCSAVGTTNLKACSTTPGECTLRYAHDSIRSNHVSRLAGVYEKDLGITTVWNTALKNGNPFRSDLVTKYMAFTREEQKKAGVSVKQAPVLLQENLATVIAPMRITLQGSTDPLVRATVARDIAVFTVAFSTTKRGDELTRTLIQRILRLPNRSGLLFNFQWGKWGRPPTTYY